MPFLGRKILRRCSGGGGRREKRGLQAGRPLGGKELEKQSIVVALLLSYPVRFSGSERDTFAVVALWRVRPFALFLLLHIPRQIDIKEKGSPLEQ